MTQNFCISILQLFFLKLQGAIGFLSICNHCLALFLNITLHIRLIQLTAYTTYQQFAPEFLMTIRLIHAE